MDAPLGASIFYIQESFSRSREKPKENAQYIDHKTTPEIDPLKSVGTTMTAQPTPTTCSAMQTAFSFFFPAAA